MRQEEKRMAAENTSNRRKSRFILFTVLILPTLVYVYFALGVPKASRAPFFGPRHAIQVTDKNGNPKTDTAYFTIPVFSAHTATGESFSSESLGRRLYIAIFMPEDSAGPFLKLLAQSLNWKKDEYKYGRFLFICKGDSAGNPPSPAPDFAADLKLGKDTGWTVYVSPQQYDSLNRQNYFVADPSRKKDPWMTYNDAVIIDAKGRIRGYYNIRQGDLLKRMKEDLTFIFQRDEGVETIESTTIKKGK